MYVCRLEPMSRSPCAVGFRSYSNRFDGHDVGLDHTACYRDPSVSHFAESMLRSYSPRRVSGVLAIHVWMTRLPYLLSQ